MLECVTKSFCPCIECTLVVLSDKIGVHGSNVLQNYNKSNICKEIST